MRNTGIKILCLFAAFMIMVGCAAKVDNSSNTVFTNSRAAAEINVKLGVFYMQKGQMQRAKHKLLLALDQAPDYSAAQSAMGYYLEKVGEIKKAEEYYLKAISLNAESGDVQNNYGTFLCRQGRYKESLKRFILATEDPNYLNSAGAYENAGICALKIPEFKRAEKYFSKALKYDSNLPSALFEVSKLQYREGDYKKAYSSLHKLLTNTGAELSSEVLHFCVKLSRRIGNKRLTADCSAKLAALSVDKKAKS